MSQTVHITTFVNSVKNGDAVYPANTQDDLTHLKSEIGFFFFTHGHDNTSIALKIPCHSKPFIITSPDQGLYTITHPSHPTHTYDNPPLPLGEIP